MGKPIDVRPSWLKSLMCQWARRELSLQDGGLGYPKKSAFLLIHSSTPVRVDPTGESARDFSQLDAALEDCRHDRLTQWVALMMYYKPWCIEAYKAEGYPHGNTTFYERLHAAHLSVSSFIYAMDGKPLAKSAKA